MEYLDTRTPQNSLRNLMDRTHELIQMRIRQPYFDWANSEDDDGTRAILQEVRTDPSIYLVETIDSLEDFDLLVDDTWE